MSARRVLLGAAALAALGAGPAHAAPPPVKHVFIVVLENEDYASTFGTDSKAPYLAQDLPKQGLLLTHYYGIGHESLDNYIAMISGQAPNPETQADCPIFTDFLPGTIGADGQAHGQRLRLPGRGSDGGQPADGQGPDVGRVHGGHGQHAHRDADVPAPALNGQDDTPSRRRPRTSTPRATTRSSTSTRSSTARACENDDVPLDAPRAPRSSADDARTTSSSRPTSATTATTSRARTASRAAWSAPTCS